MYKLPLFSFISIYSYQVSDTEQHKLPWSTFILCRGSHMGYRAW